MFPFDGVIMDTGIYLHAARYVWSKAKRGIAVRVGKFPNQTGDNELIKGLNVWN